MHNILIVDDTDVDRLLMSGLLGKSADYSIIVAEDGQQALKKIEEWPIDLILTDLQMPKMDGFELVKKVREQRLEIPVILTTGVGSEEIATKALQAGAAGYIPKSKLNKLLASTVSEVLRILNSNRSYDRLIKRTKLSRYEFELENDPSLIPLLVDFCERILNSSTPLDRIDSLRIAVAIDQALQNAILRGNLEIESEFGIHELSDFEDNQDLPMFVRERFDEEPYKSRRVEVVVEIRQPGFAIRIRDEGPGFETSLIGDLRQLSMRGTNLMYAFMDSVQYNESGNEVLMKYRFDRSKVIRKKSPSGKSAGKPVSFGRLVCEQTGSTHEIVATKFVIGRGKTSHLKLEGEQISGLHCMLVSDKGELSVINLSPKFDTLVNGSADSEEPLKTGDIIAVGSHSFKYEA